MRPAFVKWDHLSHPANSLGWAGLFPELSHAQVDAYFEEVRTDPTQCLNFQVVGSSSVFLQSSVEVLWEAAVVACQGPKPKVQ